MAETGHQDCEGDASRQWDCHRAVGTAGHRLGKGSGDNGAHDAKDENKGPHTLSRPAA